MRDMINSRGTHKNGCRGGESKGKAEGENKNEMYEIFTRSKKNDNTQTDRKINNEAKLHTATTTY